MGIVYRLKDQPPKVLHLASHRYLKNNYVDELKPTCWPPAFVYMNIDPWDAKSIVALCRTIVDRNGAHTLTYGFKGGSSRFRISGEAEMADGEHGFTCASFVMAIFSTFRIELLRTETWQPRPSDVKWQEEMIDAFNKYATAEELAVISGDKGCVRFRPTEVAASFSSDQLPVDFAYAQSAALVIEAYFKSHLNVDVTPRPAARVPETPEPPTPI
ncbi:MAG: hypothetical protein ABI193_14820 [Minicystis sp.]